MWLCSDGWAAQSDVQFDTSGLLSLLKAESFSVFTRLTQALASMNCNTMTSLTASHGQVFNLKPSVPVSGSSVILGNKKNTNICCICMYSHCLCISNKLWVHEVFKLQNCKHHLEELQLEHICLAFVTQTAGVFEAQQTIKHQQYCYRAIAVTVCTVTYIAKSHICSLNYINYSGLHNYQAVSKLSYDIFSISLTACSQGRRRSGATVGWFDPWLC